MDLFCKPGFSLFRVRHYEGQYRPAAETTPISSFTRQLNAVFGEPSSPPRLLPPCGSATALGHQLLCWTLCMSPAQGRSKVEDSVVGLHGPCLDVAKSHPPLSLAQNSILRLFLCATGCWEVSSSCAPRRKWKQARRTNKKPISATETKLPISLCPITTSPWMASPELASHLQPLSPPVQHA